MNDGTRANWRRLALVVVCLCGVSAMEYRAVALVHRFNFPAHADAAAQILLGHPTWKAYQSRLLGPSIVLGMASFSGSSYIACYQVLCFGALCLANTVCYRLLRRRAADLAMVYTVLYAALFVAFQDARWLYLWDFIDLTVMLLFAWVVVLGGNGLWQLVAIFSVELFNRESAVFIALWLVMDAVKYRPKTDSRSRLRVDWTRLTTGLACGIAGTLWTRFIRDKLCVQTSGLESWKGLHETIGGQLFVLPILPHLFAESTYLTIAVLLVILGLAALSLRRAWPLLGEKALKILLLMAALAAANFCFADVFELRVWLTFIPLVLCLAYLRQTADGRTAPDAARST